MHNLEELLGTRQVPQPVLAQIDKRHPGAAAGVTHEHLGRRRHNDLAAVNPFMIRAARFNAGP